MIARIAGKLRLHVQYDFSRYSVKFPDFPKAGIRNILCGCLFVEADKVGHLGDPVYYYHDLGHAL